LEVVVGDDVEDDLEEGIFFSVANGQKYIFMVENIF
jgi:hypothetical protein